MPIPADYHIKSGRYKNDETGVVQYACNCPGSKLTLTMLRAQRDKWTPVAATPKK